MANLPTFDAYFTANPKLWDIKTNIHWNSPFYDEAV
jgi:hypothetical protein